MGVNDRPMVGLALDPTQRRVFYSNGDTITRTALDGSGAVVVVPRVNLYVLNGVNFGTDSADLVSIEVHGTACSSIHFWSSKQIGCVTANSAHIDRDVTRFDVTVVSQSGGTSSEVAESQAQAERRAIAGYNTPLVSSVVTVPRSSSPRALAYDASTASLLWSDTSSGTIHRSTADGSFIQLVATGLFEIYGMAAANDMLYYTDHNAGRVVRVNLTAAGDLYDDAVLAGVSSPRVVEIATGGSISAQGVTSRSSASKVLLRGFNQPRGIAVDALSGNLFLTEASGRIYRARTDGRNMQLNPRKRAVFAKIIARRSSTARLDGIAVTQGKHGATPGRVFWTESNTNAVFSCTTYGAGITKLAGDHLDMVWPRAIALLHDDSATVDAHLFWTQYIGRVQRAATTGANRVAIVDEVQQSSGFAQLELEVQEAQRTGKTTVFNVE